jgi:8-oxo-dGTP pyrophosphatase MutT (NUDIX family)
MENEKEVDVVTCFLRFKGKILILKRSDLVRTSKGRWAGVAGYVEKGEKPEDTARKEIGEETGIRNARLVRKGEPFSVKSETTTFRVHPFLFEVDTDEVTIDWEHTEFRWIEPEDIEKYDTVPKLPNSLRSVLLKSS